MDRTSTLPGIAACLVLLGGAGSAHAGTPRSYDFEVLLDDRPVGTHRFQVAPDGEGTWRVDSDARFDVKLLGLVVYRYRHEAREHWQRGCLHRIEARTNDNGRELALAGRRDGEWFRVQAAREDRRKGCVAGYAYWDLERLLGTRELLNPQTGEFDAVSLESLGEESLAMAGEAVRARRYRLHGPERPVDLWYSDSGEWLQLESAVRGDRRLRYRLRR